MNFKKWNSRQFRTLPRTESWNSKWQAGKNYSHTKARKGRRTKALQRKQASKQLEKQSATFSKQNTLSQAKSQETLEMLKMRQIKS